VSDSDALRRTRKGSKLTVLEVCQVNLVYAHQETEPFRARFYLKAWATSDQIWCLRDGSIFQTTSGMWRREPFLSTWELSRADMSLSGRLASRIHRTAQPIHERLLRQFASFTTRKLFEAFERRPDTAVFGTP